MFLLSTLSICRLIITALTRNGKTDQIDSFYTNYDSLSFDQSLMILSKAQVKHQCFIDYNSTFLLLTVVLRTFHGSYLDLAGGLMNTGQKSCSACILQPCLRNSITLWLFVFNHFHMRSSQCFDMESGSPHLKQTELSGPKTQAIWRERVFQGLRGVFREGFPQIEATSERNVNLSAHYAADPSLIRCLAIYKTPSKYFPICGQIQTFHISNLYSFKKSIFNKKSFKYDFNMACYVPSSPSVLKVCLARVSAQSCKAGCSESATYVWTFNAVRGRKTDAASQDEERECTQ